MRKITCNHGIELWQKCEPCEIETGTAWDDPPKPTPKAQDDEMPLDERCYQAGYRDGVKDERKRLSTPDETDNSDYAEAQRVFIGGRILEREKCAKEIAALEAQLQTANKALEFYADKKHIVEVNTEEEYSMKVEDGATARRALGRE